MSRASTRRTSRLGRRVLQRVARTRFGARLVRSTAESGAQALRADAQGMRAESSAQWRRGDREDALDSLRRSLLMDPGSSDVWLLFGQRLIETGRSQAALVALRNALDLEPSNLVALELYHDTARLQKVGSASLVTLLDHLAERASGLPGKHRGMLDFAIAHQHRRLLDILADSPDPFTRFVVLLERTEDSGPGRAGGNAASWHEEQLPPRDRSVARAVHALARGRIEAARDALAEIAVEDYPVEAIRRAVRRASAREDLAATVAALRLYLAVRPDDPWARSKLEASQRKSAVSALNASILRDGFTLPDREDATYPPRADKALYLLHGSLPHVSNGYATRSHGLLTGMIRSGWDVDALTRPGFPYDLAQVTGTEPHEHELVDDVSYFRTSDGPVSMDPVREYVATYADAVVRRARAVHPFVIHGASNHVNGLAAVSAARRLGVPSVYEVRGLWEITRASRNPGWAYSDRFRVMKRLETDAAQAADHVLTITAALKEELVSRGVDDSKITVVPNGVDASRFEPLPRDVELSRELGLDGLRVIGYVGSVLDYEGIGLLLEAVQLLAARRADFRVLVVGDGAERARFERESVERGLGELVTFTGRVPHHEVERYYSLVDIAPFPRLPLPVCEMVSPLKPFEAMAMGKAVVASDVKALAEIVDDGVTGLLHAKGDPGSLARALEQLLDDDVLADTLGDAGRRWVRSERDWSVLAERVSDVYRSLGGRTGRPGHGSRG